MVENQNKQEDQENQLIETQKKQLDNRHSMEHKTR